MVTIMVVVLGVSPSWQLLWVPVLVVLLFCVTMAVGLFVSCANLFFRDVKYIVQVLVTFGIFFTPVFFEPTMFGPIGAPLMMLNPLAPLVEGFRLAIIDHHNLLHPARDDDAGRRVGPGVEPVVSSPTRCCGAFGGLAASLLLFHRLEFVFAEYL